MQYSEKEFEIQLAGDTLHFSGNLKKYDYSKVDAFLKEADDAITSETCKIRFKNLKFLDSAGISSLFRFILGSPKKFEIYMKSDIQWQKFSLPIIERLKKDSVKIIEE